MSWSETGGGAEVDTYFVKYRPLQGVVRRKRNVEDTAVVVETNQTGYRISGLDPGLSYAVSVAAGNRAGRGNFSMEITVECKSQCHNCVVIGDSPFTAPSISQSSQSIYRTV